MALIGHSLHFSYSEIMDMDINEYGEFLKIAMQLFKESVE